jgi:hypothetical protein
MRSTVQASNLFKLSFKRDIYETSFQQSLHDEDDFGFLSSTKPEVSFMTA